MVGSSMGRQSVSTASSTAAEGESDVVEKMAGKFESWDESGFGVIRGADGESYFAHHTNFVEYQTRHALIMVDLGQDATFVPFIDGARGGRKTAREIEYDSRSPLFR